MCLTSLSVLNLLINGEGIAMKPLSNTQLDSNICELIQEELASVAGGVTKDEDDPGHGVKQHLRGRLGPDAEEEGTIAGAGL